MGKDAICVTILTFDTGRKVAEVSLKASDLPQRLVLLHLLIAELGLSRTDTWTRPRPIQP